MTPPPTSRPAPAGTLRRPSAAAALAMALLLVGRALADPPPSPGDMDREVQAAERLQRNAAAMTQENAERLRTLVEAYVYNALGDQASMDTMRSIAAGLAGLADPQAAAKGVTMQKVLADLAAVRGLGPAAEKRTALLAVSADQAKLLAELEALLAKARAKFAGILGAKTLAAIAEEQKKLKDKTAALAVETLGLSAADLDAGMRADLTTMSRRQGKLAGELGRSIEQLEVDAKGFEGLEAAYAEAIRAVAAGLRKLDVGGMMRQAAADVAANRLVKAQATQEKIIALLAAALARLNQDPETPPFDGSGTPTSVNPGPAGGPVDGAFPDAWPFVQLLDMSVRGEYMPGFGRVPLARAAGEPEPAAWIVRLPEKDRQVLAGAARQKFPEKYAELLKSYYRALAAGEAAGGEKR